MDVNELIYEMAMHKSTLIEQKNMVTGVCSYSLIANPPRRIELAEGVIKELDGKEYVKYSVRYEIQYLVKKFFIPEFLRDYALRDYAKSVLSKQDGNKEIQAIN